jgi:hypothetical protein
MTSMLASVRGGALTSTLGPARPGSGEPGALWAHVGGVAKLNAVVIND